jgi:hypothetical protein
MNNDYIPSTSDLFKNLLETHKEEKIKLVDLVESFRETGFSILLIIFAAPMALPLPALGIAQIFALPLLFLSIQLAIGFRSPWIPQKLGNKTIERKTLEKVSGIMIPFLKKVEWFLKPRIRFLSSRFGDKFIGVACLICSISVAMPFPFSNTVPSMGIVAMAIGLLERDGLVIIGGMLIGALGCTIAILVVLFGVEVIVTIKDFITTLI